MHRRPAVTRFGSFAVSCAVLAACTEAPTDTDLLPDEPNADACAPVALLGMPSPVAPIWCQSLSTGAPTFVTATNSWTDDFDHGLQFASMGDGYRVFDHAPAFSQDCSVGHFRHNDHWMVDLGTDGCEGALMRPDRPFTFEDGQLVIEATVAAGIRGYDPAVWPELVITTSPEPVSIASGGLYAYTMFAGHYALGCRLQASRVPICAMFDDNGEPSQTANRIFEISFFQHEGADAVFGGGPFTPETDAAWRVCDSEDPDVQCRDSFRMVIERDALTIFVNDVKYMEHRGLPNDRQLPPELLDGEVYVYFASWSSRMNEIANGARFHWDRIAINP